MNEKPSVHAPSNLLVMYRNTMIAILLVLLGNLVPTSLTTLSPSVQQRPQFVMVARCVRYKPSDPPPNAPYDIFFAPQRIPRISQMRENKNQDLFSLRDSLLLPPSLLMCVVCIKGKNPHSWGNSDLPSANITLGKVLPLLHISNSFSFKRHAKDFFFPHWWLEAFAFLHCIEGSTFHSFKWMAKGVESHICKGEVTPFSWKIKDVYLFLYLFIF